MSPYGWKAWLGRLIGPLRGHRATAVYHESYREVLAGVPIDPLRADKILAFLLDQKLVRPRDVSTPAEASLQEILRVHDSEYLASLESPEKLTMIFGVSVGASQVSEIMRLQRIVAGGTTSAVKAALAGKRLVVHLGGGLHHAGPDFGMGFCAINDMAVAIRTVQAEGFQGKILIIDLDLHDANGTRAVFADDRRVFTFSIHHEQWGPDAERARSMELGPAIDDRRYLAALRESLPSVVESERPELVIYVAGTDLVKGDRLGSWEMSSEGILRRDQYVFRALGEIKPEPPLVLVLGGGYGQSSWKLTARSLGWLATGKVPDLSWDLSAAIGRLRRLHAPQDVLESTQDLADWSLSEEDLGFLSPEAGLDARVLGSFTRHGLELLLERVGFLPCLRAMGFGNPVLQVDIGSLGQTLQLYSERGEDELLMELRFRRDRTTLPGMDVLFVEWLLLQNPRAEFGESQTPLPGQRHPGLGLLKETAEFLITVCDALRMDAIVFIPERYYMAKLGRPHLGFVDPEDQRWFEEIEQVLEDLSLAEASLAFENERIKDRRDGQPVKWRKMLMQLPVSSRARRRARQASSMNAPRPSGRFALDLETDRTQHPS